MLGRLGRGGEVSEYRFVEICAGAGGQSLGLELAGFEHELSVELDADACGTLRHNRPHWKVAEGDVASTSAPHTTCRLLTQTFRPVTTVSAPSVIWTATRAANSLVGLPTSRRALGLRPIEIQVTTTLAATMSAPRRCAKCTAILASQCGGTRCPNINGKSGIARPAPVCRIMAPNRI